MRFVYTRYMILCDDSDWLEKTVLNSPDHGPRHKATCDRRDYCFYSQTNRRLLTFIRMDETGTDFCRVDTFRPLSGVWFENKISIIKLNTCQASGNNGLGQSRGW